MAYQLPIPTDLLEESIQTVVRRYGRRRFALEQPDQSLQTLREIDTSIASHLQHISRYADEAGSAIQRLRQQAEPSKLPAYLYLDLARPRQLLDQAAYAGRLQQYCTQDYEACRDALWHYRSAQSEQWLANTLDAEESSLLRLGFELGARYLEPRWTKRLLRWRHSAWHVAACLALARHELSAEDEADLLETARGLLDQPDAEVRRIGLRLLVDRGCEQAIPIALDWLDRGRAPAVAWAVATLAPAEVMDRLNHHPEWLQGADAVRCLGQIGTLPALNLLHTVLEGEAGLKLLPWINASCKLALDCDLERLQALTSVAAGHAALTEALSVIREAPAQQRWRGGQPLNDLKASLPAAAARAPALIRQLLYWEFGMVMRAPFALRAADVCHRQDMALDFIGSMARQRE